MSVKKFHVMFLKCVMSISVNLSLCAQTPDGHMSIVNDTSNESLDSKPVRS